MYAYIVKKARMLLEWAGGLLSKKWSGWSGLDWSGVNGWMFTPGMTCGVKSSTKASNELVQATCQTLLLALFILQHACKTRNWIVASARLASTSVQSMFCTYRSKALAQSAWKSDVSALSALFSNYVCDIGEIKGATDSVPPNESSWRPIPCSPLPVVSNWISIHFS